MCDAINMHCTKNQNIQIYRLTPLETKEKNERNVDEFIINFFILIFFICISFFM